MKSNLNYFKAFCLLTFIVLQSCNVNSDMSEKSLNKAAMITDGESFSSEEIAGKSKPISVKKNQRKLIRNGTIRFKVKNSKAEKFSLAKEVEKLEGYLGNERSTQIGNQKQTELEIHVPSHQFNRIVEFIEKQAVKIDEKNITIDDVTEEFVDLTARTKTKKEVLERFRKLLQTAKNMEEIMSVESKIGEIQAEIESAEGRLQYIEQNVSFSCLKLGFYTETPIDVVEEPNRFATALEQGWEGFVSFLVILTRNWFTLLILFGIGYFFRKPIKQFFVLLKGL